MWKEKLSRESGEDFTALMTSDAEHLETYLLLGSVSHQEHFRAVRNTKCLNPCSRQWGMSFSLKSNLLASSSRSSYYHNIDAEASIGWTRSQRTQLTSQPSPIRARDKTTPPGVEKLRGNSTYLRHTPSRENCHFGIYLHLHIWSRRHLYFRNKSAGQISASTWERTRWLCRRLKDVVNSFSCDLLTWCKCYVIHQGRGPLPLGKAYSSHSRAYPYRCCLNRWKTRCHAHQLCKQCGMGICHNVHWCHVMSRHSCRAMSCHFIPCYVMSCGVMTWHVLSCHVMSCHVMSWDIMPCHAISCGAMSCRVMSCHTTSSHLMSC